MTGNIPSSPGRRRSAGRIAVWTGLATIGALAVAGAALAAPGIATAANPAPKASTSAAAPAQQGKRADHKGARRGLLRPVGRVVHGQMVVKGKDGAFITIYAQRGTVSAVSPTSITIRSTDGYTSTYTITAETKVAKQGKAAAIGDVKVGGTVGVLAAKSADATNARRIILGPPKPTD